MTKFKKMLKNFRVIILLIFLVLAIVSINPNPWREGVTIRTVTTESSANIAGMTNPDPSSTPMARERIIEINDKPISDVTDYNNLIQTLEINSTVKIKTNERSYYLMVKPDIEIIELDELIEKNITEEIFNNETQEFENITKTIPINKTIENILGPEEIGIEVYNSPENNIRKGLDLQGGTRVLLEPEKVLESEEMSQLIESMKQRLNVYGLSDVTVTQANDLPVYLGGSGKQYVLIEIAGASKQEVTDLLAKQGKFEAKIGEDVVFIGGTDITYVCRDATCSGIDPNQGCQQTQDGWYCRFRFSIALTPEAAERQAEITSKLDVVTESGQEYLSKNLDLFLDDGKVDDLRIGADLKGRAVTDIQISGSGSGSTQQDAMFNSLEQMKKLQTVLQTGSLPVKLEIANIEAISPTLGKEFVENSIFIGLLAILAVGIVVFLRYRKIQIAGPLVITMIAEVILLLGLAALIGWNLDLAAIAGIIIAVGTGVDHLIVITDEILSGDIKEIYNWKERVKEGFNIVMGAYSTTVVAMIPLVFAGAGLLKGFAITTILGATFGVFIARPAYAAIIEIILKE